MQKKTKEQGPREKKIHARGNSAQQSKDSILVEAKNMLSTLHYTAPNVPAIQRREGAWHEMKLALLALVRHFCQARANREMRLAYIDEMIGDMGVVDAMFDELLDFGVLTDDIKLRLARHMDRMDRGIMLWRDATDRRWSGLMNQDHGEVDG